MMKNETNPKTTVTERQKRSVTCPTCCARPGRPCRSSRQPDPNTLGGGWGGPPDLDTAHRERRAAYLARLGLRARRVWHVVLRGTYGMYLGELAGPFAEQHQANAWVADAPPCLRGSYEVEARWPREETTDAA